MKPTQEQVIAWARAVGMERCNCEPRCHLHTGGMGSLTALVDIAYEAGRKDENEACAKVCEAGTGEPIQMKTLEILRQERGRIADAIRARREQ